MGKYFELVVCDCSCCVGGCSSIAISGRVEVASASRLGLCLTPELISIMTTNLHHNTDR